MVYILNKFKTLQRIHKTVRHVENIQNYLQIFRIVCTSTHNSGTIVI